MGRSTKTTKSGKFMNPTDQWRKLSRRRELKKNKKQRTAVREAVLRAKEPSRMLREIEEIEKIEIDSGNVPLPNEKSLRERKRKYEETIKRMLRYYEKEDHKKAAELKKQIADSETRRRQMAKVYRDYQTARSQFDVSDIPLPNEDTVSGIPLPASESSEAAVKPTAPGMPPPPPKGPPPKDLYAPFKLAAGDDDDNDEDFDDFPSDDSDSEDEQMDNEENGEGDAVGERKRTVRFQDESKDSSEVKLPVPPVPPVRVPPGPPPGIPPMIMRPPGTSGPIPVRPGFGAPPGPPPGLPPHLSAQPPEGKQSGQRGGSSAIISAGPTVSAPPVKNPPPTGGSQTADSVTFSAEPQIRNMKAEVTKFLPTTLRVRRDVPKNVKGKLPTARSTSVKGPPAAANAPKAPSTRTTMRQGDAYDTFMKEMSSLL